jgi:hypothetical protein
MFVRGSGSQKKHTKGEKRHVLNNTTHSQKAKTSLVLNNPIETHQEPCFL